MVIFVLVFFIVVVFAFVVIIIIIIIIIIMIVINKKSQKSQNYMRPDKFRNFWNTVFDQTDKKTEKTDRQIDRHHRL